MSEQTVPNVVEDPPQEASAHQPPVWLTEDGPVLSLDVISPTPGTTVTLQDGSFVTYGTVTPTSAAVSAKVFDSNNNQVGTCTRKTDLSALPGPPDWAFDCTGIPTGHLRLEVTAVNGIASVTVPVNFTAQ